jgi:N-methylhydantoinase A
MLFRQLDDYRATPVFDGTRLKPGAIITGPAVVEEDNTTIVVFPGFDLELTRLNAYLMRMHDPDGTSATRVGGGG